MLILVCFLSLIWKESTTHKCIHGEKQAQIKLKGTIFNENGFTKSTSYSRLLQSAIYRPINIVFDFSSLPINSNNTSIIKTVLNNRVLPFIQSAIQVNGASTISPFSKTE